MGDLVKKAVEMEAKAQLTETLVDTSSNFLTIVIFSVAMLVGCYLSGIVPLTLTLSEKKIKYISLAGAGLLVGTALAVIIPEGVHALYATQQHKEVSSDAKGEHTDHDHEQHRDIHMMIGVTLVLGFVFMLIIDHFGSAHSSGDAKSKQASTATVGLVVHAAADGIALGAAANTAQNEVTMIVFVAIMLHKAPAAFGLVSFLLHEGVERPRIRRHLAAFAASAPLMALVTYGALSMHHALLPEATGLSLLFSAGTFLYVATVHVLPEVQNHDEPASRLELLCLVSFTLLPLLLSMTHHH